MTSFMSKVREITENDSTLIRVLEMDENGKTEMLEKRKASYCQNLYSVAKAFTMTAIGFLVDDGKLNLDDKVCEILEEDLPHTGMDERWRNCTVRMALQHKIGLPQGFLDIDVNPASKFGRDYLKYMMQYPLECAPGEKYSYTDGAYYLLSRIVGKKAGVPLDTFLWQRLMYPMGAQEMAWSRCPLGHPMGATGMYTGAEEIAKLGCLYLNEGIWKGKRLLSAEWVQCVLREELCLYWNTERTWYGKGGMYGQLLAVLPEAKRVLAIQAFEYAPEKLADLAGEWYRR